MAKRKIIKINGKKCTGCGLCIPNCPEGALQMIDGKARLISDLFCDGLGARIGHCPEGAIKIEEREARPYDESKVMENIIKQGKNVIKAHLEHLRDHNATEYFNEALEILKKKKIKANVAVLGGGDIIFPIITAGVMLNTFGILSALLVMAGATFGLGLLFFMAKKKKFYPAMPFITTGIFLGIGLSYFFY